jgi:hypothetical protein
VDSNQALGISSEFRQGQWLRSGGNQFLGCLLVPRGGCHRHGRIDVQKVGLRCPEAFKKSACHPQVSKGKKIAKFLAGSSSSRREVMDAKAAMALLCLDIVQPSGRM